MGERGWTLHLHRVTADRARTVLSALGFRGAVLAHDAVWCSVGALDEDEDDRMRGIHPTEAGLVVVDPEQFMPPDHRAIARALDCEAVAVGFDDELGVTFAFASPKGSRGEFSVPLHKPPRPSREDLRFFDALAAAGLVAPTFGAELTRALSVPPREARDWVDAHGVERLFGLPYLRPVHPGSTMSNLRYEAPDAIEIVPVAAAERRPVPPPHATAAAAPPSRPWTAGERAIVALHQHYVTRLWRPNDWTLFDLYKRHLPADQRDRVEAVIGTCVMGGDEAEQRAAVEAILALAWEGTDWAAVLHNPRLLDAEATDEERADWRRRLAMIAPN